MTTIILLHSHYSETKLDQVKNEMMQLGSPTIRGFQTETGWYLIEGSHRARAAQELGIAINLVDVSNETVISWQQDGEEITSCIEDVIDTVIFGRNDLDACAIEI